MYIFSTKTNNLGRQVEVDWLRGFTAINVIICHVGLYLGNSINTGLWTFCDIFGSEFGAPIFMALMGISAVYSRHQKPIEMLKRGIRLFIAGYALSFFRSLLPMLIWGNIDEWASIEAFFVVDIFQLAGLSFMFMALLKKLKLPSLIILAISLVMVIIDQFIMLPESISWDSEILTGAVNLFCPVTGWSCFPFLTWFFFPALGLVFADMLTHCTNKKRLYAILMPVGLVGVMYVYYQFQTLYPNYTNYYFGNNFYYMGLKNVILTVFFICFSLGVWFFLDGVLHITVKKFLFFLSKNLNIFYVLSWIIISILIHIQAIYKWNLNTISAIGMMVLLVIVCTALTKLWCRLGTVLNDTIFKNVLLKIFS